MPPARSALRLATLAALPLGLAACVVGPAPPPATFVAPPPMLAPPPPPFAVAPQPRYACWTEARRVFVRDAFGRPVPVVQQRRVCGYR